MWKVLFTGKCEKEIRKLFESGELTDDDCRVIALWIKQVKKHGPESLIKGKSSTVWNDHSLDRKWTGFRSSSFSFSGRIIYTVSDTIITVKVVRVTTNHDYS